MPLTLIPHLPLQIQADACATDPPSVGPFEVVCDTQASQQRKWGPWKIGSAWYSAFWDSAITQIVSIAKTLDLTATWIRVTSDTYEEIEPGNCGNPDSQTRDSGTDTSITVTADSRYIYVSHRFIDAVFPQPEFAHQSLSVFDTQTDQWSATPIALPDQDNTITGPGDATNEHYFQQLVSYGNGKNIALYARVGGETVAGKVRGRVNLYDTFTATEYALTAGAGLSTNFRAAGAVLGASGLIHIFLEERAYPQGGAFSDAIKIWHQSFNPATGTFGTLQQILSDCSVFVQYGVPAASGSIIAFPYVYGNTNTGDAPNTDPLGCMIGTDVVNPTWSFEAIDATLPPDSYPASSSRGNTAGCAVDMSGTLLVMWCTPTAQGLDYNGDLDNVSGSLVYAQRNGVASWSAPIVYDSLASPISPTGPHVSSDGTDVVFIVPAINTSIDPFGVDAADGEPYRVYAGILGVSPPCTPCPSCPPPSPPSCPTCTPPSTPSCPSCPEPPGYC